jgi:hypothetical protein
MIQQMEDAAWVISGVEITTNDQTEISPDLSVGSLVLIKGWIQADGAWLAQSITIAEDDESEFEFTGKLESMDPWKVAGIAFEIRDYTLVATDLKVGEMVHVKGQIDANGAWIATEIERVDEEESSKMIIIGAVISMDPWVIGGIPLSVGTDTVISGEIKVGMLVRVELVLLSDGTWKAVKIEPISGMVWFPGCMDVVATVVSTTGSQVQLLNWPLMTVTEDATIEGTLAPNNVVRLRVCFDDAMVIKITYIVVIQVDTEDENEDDQGEDTGGKVLVCHKPGGKKGGKTLSIGRSALPAHLGHGDYQGSCK